MSHPKPVSGEIKTMIFDGMNWVYAEIPVADLLQIANRAAMITSGMAMASARGLDVPASVWADLRECLAAMHKQIIYRTHPLCVVPEADRDRINELESEVKVLHTIVETRHIAIAQPRAERAPCGPQPATWWMRSKRRAGGAERARLEKTRRLGKALQGVDGPPDTIEDDREIKANEQRLFRDRHLSSKTEKTLGTLWRSAHLRRCLHLHDRAALQDPRL